MDKLVLLNNCRPLNWEATWAEGPFLYGAEKIHGKRRINKIKKKLINEKFYSLRNDTKNENGN
jgi:hypothetical protein